jgi:hypothetical protein
MKTILSKKTQSTPEIVYNSSNKTINITGRSLMFDPQSFWSLKINVIKNISLRERITLNINFEYINTLSLRCLSRLIQINNIDINWVCDEYDDDMIEIGEMLGINTKQKINFLIEN